MNNDYRIPYGMWEVTTEADAEGRSVKRLGIYKGYIDDIAFALAERCYYSLEFTPFNFTEIPIPTKTRDRVNINLDINSGTWKMDPSERKRFFEILFAGRKVKVEDGTSYASVTLYRDNTTAEKAKREAALNKLTDEEKRLLGLT